MDKLFLIGGTDSIGVPYTKDNKTNSGFFEQIENFLSNHFEVTTFNFFHMSTYNTNSFILECLKKNYSLAEIKVQQNQMLRKCKYSGVYPYLELPKNFLIVVAFDGDSTITRFFAITTPFLSIW